MQAFLQYYINMNFEKSITTLDLRYTWETWVQDNWSKNEVNGILAKINWSQWMYLSELSPEPLNFTTQEAIDSANIATGFITLNGTGYPDKYEEYKAFYSNLKVVFQDTL